MKFENFEFGLYGISRFDRGKITAYEQEREIFISLINFTD
jgi:hypothetical protein